MGDVRRDAPGEADGVALLEGPRLPSCRDRLRMTSDFIDEGRFSPCSFKLYTVSDDPSTKKTMKLTKDHI